MHELALSFHNAPLIPDIFEAIDNDDLEKIKKILDADSNNYNQYKVYLFLYKLLPLQYALFFEKHIVAHYLISLKVNLKGSLFYTDNAELIKALLNAGADVTELNDNDLDPVTDKLNKMKSNNHRHYFECVVELLKAGAFLNLTKVGSLLGHTYVEELFATALVCGFQKQTSNHNDELKSKEYIHKLVRFCSLKNIIIVNFRDSTGNTLLHQLVLAPTFPQALRNAKIKLVLLTYPSLIDAQNNSGNAPLHYALVIEDKALISLFLRIGSNITRSNKLSLTPTDFICNKPEVMNLFKQLYIKKTESIISA